MKLTQAVVGKLQPREGRYVVFDEAMAGFGVRVEASGTKTYCLEYRPAGGGRSASKRRVVIGRAGPGGITCDDARKAARALLAQVALGADPSTERAQARRDEALETIAERFKKEHLATKRKAGTAATYENVMDRHVLPVLGKKKLREIQRADVDRMHRKASATPTTANRAVAILSSIWTWAAKQGLCELNDNPCKGVEKNREQGRERFLSDEEFARLGAALVEAETRGLPWQVDETKPKAKHLAAPENRRTKIDPNAINAIRALLLTGCRLREILNLRWSEIDLQRGLLMLSDSKTGRRPVLLSAAALAVLEAQPKLEGCEFVFPGPSGEARSDLKKPWLALTRRAGLEGLRLHDLRHTHASVGAGGGVPLQVIGALLGHKQVSTTARYAHLAADPVRAAADHIGAHIERALSGKTPKKRKAFKKQ